MFWINGPMACTLEQDGIMLGQIIRNGFTPEGEGMWSAFDYHTGDLKRLPGVLSQNDAKAALEAAQS